MATSTEAMGGRSPANLKPEYIYEAPVRIWHWVHAISIVVLSVTGYLIANPLPSVPGEASESFLMGNIRMIHFIASYVFTIGLLVRIYWGFVGNKYSRELVERAVPRDQVLQLPHPEDVQDEGAQSACTERDVVLQLHPGPLHGDYGLRALLGGAG